MEWDFIYLSTVKFCWLTRTNISRPNIPLKVRKFIQDASPGFRKWNGCQLAHRLFVSAPYFQDELNHKL